MLPALSFKMHIQYNETNLIAHVVEGNIEHFHPSKNDCQSWLTTPLIMVFSGWTFSILPSIKHELHVFVYYCSIYILLHVYYFLGFLGCVCYFDMSFALKIVCMICNYRLRMDYSYSLFSEIAATTLAAGLEKQILHLFYFCNERNCCCYKSLGISIIIDMFWDIYR
jgi:hypothetical protein